MRCGLVLTAQAARATEQIAGEISAIQSVSDGVVGTLKTIRDSVQMMRDHVMSAASAVEEQSVVTQEMSSNMQGTSQAVLRISNNINATAGAVERVSQAVGTTKEAARVLAR
jgi:methyl-accepting chemotaxis protein